MSIDQNQYQAVEFLGDHIFRTFAAMYSSDAQITLMVDLGPASQNGFAAVGLVLSTSTSGPHL